MVLFLHKSVTISLNFLQCPPRWTTLQVIISPGKNPLPALVSIKYSTDGDHEKFYALATPHMWDLLPMQHHVYKDPVQTAVREKFWPDPLSCFLRNSSTNRTHL